MKWAQIRYKGEEDKITLTAHFVVSESFESKVVLRGPRAWMFQYRLAPGVFWPYPAWAKCYLLLWNQVHSLLRFPQFMFASVSDVFLVGVQSWFLSVILPFPFSRWRIPRCLLYYNSDIYGHKASDNQVSEIDPLHYWSIMIDYNKFLGFYRWFWVKLLVSFDLVLFF